MAIQSTDRNQLAKVLADTDQAKAELDRLARGPTASKIRRTIKRVRSKPWPPRVELEGQLRSE
jgi:hypothetical protein